MRYNEVFAKIIFLTKLNNITQMEIGLAIGLDKSAANKRAKRNSKFKPEEIRKIEEYFKVSLDSIEIIPRRREEENRLYAAGIEKIVEDMLKKKGIN